MPYRIVEVERLAPTLTRLVVEAPLVARKRQAGHFVIVRLDETGERIPMACRACTRPTSSSPA